MIGPIILALLFMARAPAEPQPRTAAPLSFEIASIKTNTDSLLWMAPRRTGGRIRWMTTIRSLVAYAFRVPYWRISGQISSKQIFVIDATFDPAANEDQVCAMFQSLLE